MMALRYDVASQIINILHKITATNTPINNADYLYNAVGNRTQLTDRRGAQIFGYDNLDRLTSASHPLPPTSQTFAYDPVGNRISNGSLANAGNQLTENTQFIIEYDANGNQTKKTSKTTNNFTVYTYDAENRLTKVEEFVAGNPTPAATSTYRYDGFGRRIEKVTQTGTRRYIYDGEDILLEYDGSNVLQARYTHGPGIDEPIVIIKAGSTYFYHQDGSGTVTDLTDATGGTARSYVYDSYGTLIDQTGTVDQPYAYTGRELDTESGLLYYRARYYDPTTGRFLQKDPIGLLSGTNNLYQYVSSNPTNWTDPTGLSQLCVSVLLGREVIDELRVKPPVVRRYGGYWVVPKPGLDPDRKHGIRPGIAIELWKIDHIFRRYDEVRFYQIIEKFKVVCVDSGEGPCGIPWETRMEYIEERKSDPIETLIRTWTEYSIEKLYKLF